MRFTLIKLGSFVLLTVLPLENARATTEGPSECGKVLRDLITFGLDNQMGPFDLKMVEVRSQIESYLRKEVEGCPLANLSECGDKALAAAVDLQKIPSLDELLNETKTAACVAGKRASLFGRLGVDSNMVLNLGTSLGTMVVAYRQSVRDAKGEGKPKPQFNYALVTAGLVFTIYRSIVQCQNELGSDLSGAPRTRGQEFREKFIRYAKLNAVGNVIYVTLIAAQDVVTGKNPFEKDNLERYFKEFAISFAWDTGMGVLNIAMLDKLQLVSLPGMRETIAQKIREGVLKPVFVKIGGRPTLLLKANGLAQVPGYLLDIFVRTALTIDRTVGFIKTRETVLDWTTKDTTPPK